MNTFKTLQSIQKQLADVDEVIESFYDADGNHVSVTYKTGYQFRVERVIDDYDQIGIVAQSDESGGDNQAKLHVGPIEE